MAPEDVQCESFDLTYTRIAGEKPLHHQRGGGGTTTSGVPATTSSGVEHDLHRKVDVAIETFLQGLSQIGPELLSVRRIVHYLCERRE